MEDDSAARDVLATYHEVRHRESKELDAYQAAVRVYKGHHPTVSDVAAREAVNKILATAQRDRKRGSSAALDP